jgi:hypothetical protein
MVGYGVWRGRKEAGDLRELSQLSALAHQAILSCGEESSSAAHGPLILGFVICRFLQLLLVHLCRRLHWSTTTTRPLRKCSYKVISDEGGAGLLNDIGPLAGKSTDGLFLTGANFFLTRICSTEKSIDNNPGLH